MRRTLLGALCAAALLASLASPVGAHSSGEPIWFPVGAPFQYVDSFGDGRGGRSHEGVDIHADQMREVYAAWSGEIASFDGSCAEGQYCSAYSLRINGDDGRTYFYVHLNNDTPGRPEGCDGRGGMAGAFSSRLVAAYRERGSMEGLRVERGEHVAYVGSSGNASCGVDHLHFEIWDGHGWDAPPINPYPDLRAAEEAGYVTVPGQVEALPADRVAGADRVLTSVALSRAAFDAAGTVVLAPAEVYPEALLAAPLAAARGGPVLLAWGSQTPERDVLPDAVAAEIRRLGATAAVLVGSRQRLDPAVEGQLASKAGLDPDAIERIAAPDRYELSRRVAERVLAHHGLEAEAASSQAVMPGAIGGAGGGSGGTQATVSPLLALGEHADPARAWPDALSAAPLAAQQVVPVLLTRPGELPAATRAVLERGGVSTVRIVGGPAAVSPAVEQEIRDAGQETRRLAGATRYRTSLAVAGEMLGAGASPAQVLLATGRGFADALASGAAVARLGGVQILVDGAEAAGAPAVLDWVEATEGVERLTAVGGEQAVTAEVLAAVATAAAATD